MSIYQYTRNNWHTLCEKCGLRLVKPHQLCSSGTASNDSVIVSQILCINFPVHFITLSSLPVSRNMYASCPFISRTRGGYYSQLVDMRMTHETDTAFNPSPPSAPYMRRRTDSTLVRVMACRLFGAKPNLNQRRVIVNWTLRDKLQWNLFRNIFFFHSWNCIRRCRLRNGGHFILEEMSYRSPW